MAPSAISADDAIKTDIANFKAALDASGVEEGFMTAIAPGSTTRISNAYYKTDEEFVFAAPMRCARSTGPSSRRG